MNSIKLMIPYCADCMRKTKKDGLEFGEYYCDVVADILPDGIVTPDTDGSQCVNDGCYLPPQDSNVPHSL